MIVLAWKLSLIDFIAERLNELPVLLLDDVLSELDQQKRVNLFFFDFPGNPNVYYDDRNRGTASVSVTKT